MPESAQTPETPEATATVAPQPDTSELERAARLDAERRAAFAEGRAAVAEQVLMSAPRQDNQPDDLADKVIGADITITPEERKRALDAILERQRLEIASQNKQMLDARLAAERQAVSFDLAISTVLGSRPDLNDPRNRPNFQAAMTKAKAEADQRGEALSPLQLMQSAVRVYDTVFKTPTAPAVPFVEGSQRPDLNSPMVSQAPPPGPSKLEKMYGMEAGKIGEIPDMGSEEMDKEIAEYIKQKNYPLMKRGINTGIKSIPFYKD